MNKGIGFWIFFPVCIIITALVAACNNRIMVEAGNRVDALLHFLWAHAEWFLCLPGGVRSPVATTKGLEIPSLVLPYT